MSGGGGGGRPPGNGGGGVPDGGDECLKTYKGVRLSTPKDISKLHVGDKLDLAVRDKSGAPVLYADKAGKEMGTIVFRSSGKIIECIRRNYAYVAAVVELDGGNCILNISPK